MISQTYVLVRSIMNGLLYLGVSGGWIAFWVRACVFTVPWRHWHGRQLWSPVPGKRMGEF
jgi:hypothetical protein